MSTFMLGITTLLMQCRARMAESQEQRGDVQSYGRFTVFIHWLMALAIIGMYPLGLYIDSLTYYDAAYQTVPHWHKSIGLMVLAALMVRLVWKLVTPQPGPISSHGAVVRLATAIGHLSLYLLMAITLISGYMISTADGDPIQLFNWFSVPALPALVENQEDVAGDIHYWSATLLIVLAGIHAMAALKHHFIDRDNTLKRMTAIN